MAIPDYGWLLVSIVRYCWLLVAIGSYCSLLVAKGGYWWLVATHGYGWLLKVVAIDGYCWLLVTIACHVAFSPFTPRSNLVFCCIVCVSSRSPFLRPLLVRLEWFEWFKDLSDMFSSQAFRLREFKFFFISYPLS